MENNQIKKDFLKDKKNIIIIILSTLLLLSFSIIGENDKTSGETNTLNSKISNLEIENQKLKENSSMSQQTILNTATEKETTTPSSEDTSEIVWVGESGNKYHTQNCRTLKGAGHQITLQQALSEGRQACKVCH